jgi:hypothetical protein
VIRAVIRTADVEAYAHNEKQLSSCTKVAKRPNLLGFLTWRTSIDHPLVAYGAARAVKLFLRTSNWRADWLLKHLEARRIIQVDARGYLKLKEAGADEEK